MALIKWCAFSLSGALLLGCGIATGAADFAKDPQRVRQTYSDGTFTEMSCGSDAPRDGSESCSFTINEDGVSRTYRFKPDSDYGGSIDSYHYFTSVGDDFSLSFEVTCQEIDLQLKAGATGENSNCRVFMEPVNGKLIRTRVVLMMKTAEDFITVDRELAQ